MLPFLDKKKIAGTIVAKAKSNGTVKDLGNEDEHDSGLLSAAEDLIQAVKSGDAAAVADALKAAFQIVDSEPHVEGEHIEDEA